MGKNGHCCLLFLSTNTHQLPAHAAILSKENYILYIAIVPPENQVICIEGTMDSSG